MIAEHRYIPNVYKDACVCGKHKNIHKYKSNIIISRLENDLYGYQLSLEKLPFYTGELNA